MCFGPCPAGADGQLPSSLAGTYPESFKILILIPRLSKLMVSQSKKKTRKKNAYTYIYIWTWTSQNVPLKNVRENVYGASP